MLEGLHAPTILAFGALVSVLAVIFYALLYPLREKQALFETELKEVKTEISGLKTEIGGLKTEIGGLKSGQARLESKLDLLLTDKKA